MLYSILVPRHLFTLESAVKWLAEHGHKFNDLDRRSHMFRFRQADLDPRRSTYSKQLQNGIVLIFQF